jgi:hypothetical protein
MEMENEVENGEENGGSGGAGGALESGKGGAGGVPAGAEVPVAVPGDKAGESGRDYKGDYERLFAEHEELRKSHDGLRRKLAEPKQVRNVTVEDLAEELGGIEDESDRQFAEKFIGALGKAGLEGKRAKEFLGELGKLYKEEDPKAVYERELEKLGGEKEEVLGPVHRFRDAMKESGDWKEEDFKALERATETADGVRLIAKILRSAHATRAGQFSVQNPGGTPTGESSLQEKIDLYSRAYALQRTDPAAAQAELSRLAKLYEK